SIARARRAGHASQALPLSPAEKAVLEARLSLERRFRPLQAELMSRAARVGAGIDASRRPGWRPPRATGTRRFATAGAAQAPAPGVRRPPAREATSRFASRRTASPAAGGGGASWGDGRFTLDPADTVVNPVDPPPHNRTFYRKHAEALSRFYDVMSYGHVRV